MRSSNRSILMVLLTLLVAGASRGQVSQWTNVGPEGPGPALLVFHPQDPATIYAGSTTGVFKTKDGGENWSNAGLIGWNVLSLVIDPLNPETLYAATVREAVDDTWNANQVFKSTDGGTTWNEAGSGLPDYPGTQLLPVARENAATLYALAGNFPRGLFRSTDGGASWSSTSGSPAGQLYSMVVDPQDSTTVYAAILATENAGTLNARSVSKVFKSRDRGASWIESDSGLPLTFLGQASPVMGLTIDPKNPRTLYAAVMPVGVYKSTDGGASWRASNSGLPSNSGRTPVCCDRLFLDPQNPNTLYASGLPASGAPTAMYKTTNGGASWTTETWPPVFRFLSAIDPVGTLYGRAGETWSKSSNGGTTWNPVPFRLRNRPVSALAIDPLSSTTLRTGTSSPGVSHTIDGGLSWFSANTPVGLVATLVIDPQNPDTVYAGTSNSKVEDGYFVPCNFSSTSGIFKSLDGGLNWTDTQVGFGCISAIVLDPQNQDTVYAASWYHGGVYKTTDGGASWSVVNSGLPGGRLGVYVGALAIDPKNPGTLYAGSGGGLFKSTNGGASWNDTGLTPGAFSLAIDPRNTTTVYAITADGLFKSTDGAANWRYLFPSSSNINTVLIHPQTTSTIFAGTDDGLVQSFDGGENWTPIPGGPGFIRFLVLDPQDPNKVYAGGPGGLFAISLRPNGDERE